MTDEPRYQQLERRGEEIYDEMYKTSAPGGLLSETKECFWAAIAAAESDGLAAEARRLEARLDNIVAAYRSEFT
jgi:hypothetical protein